MSARQDLINQFIEEHGKYIEEECNRQKGNRFFLEQFIADDPNGEVYVLTEEGQMELISEANGNKTKKSFKKEEIRNKIAFNKIKHYIQPFQVIQAYFPFTNKTNQYAPRPVLAVPIRKNEYRFMMITTGTYTDVIYRRYETGIVDWKQAGLDHFSYARTNVIVDEDGLFFTSKSKIYGSLTDKDIISITKMLRTFREETFTNPVAFMYWLISHKVSDTIAIDGGQNNNVNPIQTIYDIEESKHANCVDIGIVVYKMCNAHKEFKPSSVGTVSWVVNNHRTCGHIFALFKYKHNTYIFDYDQCNCIGRFPNYKSSSFERAANEFSTSIKREHPHQDVRNLSLDNQLVYVLNDQDLKSLNNTNQYVDQREWLKDYSALYKSKPRNIIQGKFYRVYYNGIGIYEALRKKVGWDWKTVKQDPDINWLPTPEVKEYKDNYRSFFTTLGYKTFQAKTMKVIDKYLDPEKVEVREYNDLQGKLMYQDQYQVVVDQGSDKMNKSDIKTIDDMTKFIHEAGEWFENKLYPDPITKDLTSMNTLNESKDKYWTRSELNDRSKKKKFDKIKDFKQFCKEISSVEEALNYFIVEKIVWGPTDEDTKKIIWPDELIRTKTGVCFDHAIFFHYFCRVKKIESRICLITWEGPEPWMFFGHAIPCFKRNDKIFAVIYFRPTLGWMAGPYDSWEDCKDNIKQLHMGMINYEYYHKSSYAYADYMTEEGIAELDKAYGDPNINQVQFLCRHGYKAIRGTYFMKFRIKGFTFPDPRVFAYDVLTKMRDLLGLDNRWTEETELDKNIEEGFIELEAKKREKTIHNQKKKLDLRKIPTNIKDFKEFLQKIKTPEMVMKWFLKVKVRWTPHGGSNDHPFQWPDWLIKQKMGNCFDQSIFLHYFCRAKHIEHKMYLVTWIGDNGQGTGHAVPLYKKGNYVYIFTYLNPKMGFIAGPFRSWGEAKGVLDKYFLMHINQFFKSPSTPYSSYLSDDDMLNFDKYYNNRKITQTEYIIEGLGKNMRSSHMFKIKAKGFAFPNPILPAYDFIVTVFSIIATIYNYVAVDEDTEIEYEDNSEVLQESIDRKYERNYKDFDEFCEYIKTPQEVMNWYKINRIEWNTPTPTGEYYKKPVTWPDYLLKEKKGNCFDHALFMHYFCERNNIEHYIVRFVRYKALRANDKYIFLHHFVCILNTDAGWVCFEYDSIPPNEPSGYSERKAMRSSLIGPYKTKEECAKFFSDFYDHMFEEYNKTVMLDWKYRDVAKPQTIFLNDKAMAIIDRNYNDRNFTQEELYNLLKSQMGDLKYEGQYYEYGGFFSDALNQLVYKIGKVRNFFREDAINEEKLSADERRCFGLPKKKKYPMPDEAHVRAAIRFFNHCDPEDEEELARNIKKYMKKYNMKDVNVSDNNRFSKYYHPEKESKEEKPVEEKKETKKVLSHNISNEAYEAYLYIRASVNAARRSLGLIETSAALAGPVVGMETNDQTVQMSNPGMFLIHYSNDKETGYGITNDLRTKYFIRHDVKKNKLIKEEFDAFLEGKYIDIYTIPISCKTKWTNLLNQAFNNPGNPTILVNNETIKNLYEYFSDKRELCSDQIVYDDKFHPVSITWLELLYTPTLVNSHKTVLPCLQENYTGGDIFKRIQLPKGIQEFVKSSMHSNELLLCEDPEGYYLLDEANDLVTRHITQEELEVITNAVL